MSKVFDFLNYSSSTEKRLSVCSFVLFCPCKCEQFLLSLSTSPVYCCLWSFLDLVWRESIKEPFTDCEIDFYNWETAGNICISEGSKNQTALYHLFTANPKAVLLDKSYRITWIMEERTTGHQLVLPPTPCCAATSTHSDQPWGLE